MDMKTAEVPTIVKSFTDGQISEVLVPESHDFAFSHKSSKLVPACWGQFAQLDTTHFCTDCRSKVGCGNTLYDELGVA